MAAEICFCREGDDNGSVEYMDFAKTHGFLKSAKIRLIRLLREPLLALRSIRVPSPYVEQWNADATDAAQRG
jgi:hypothetical protein